MNLSSYPLFLPPSYLATKSAKDWTTSESKAYFEWLLNNLEQRITTFLDIVEVNSNSSFEALLKEVGDKLEEILLQENFHLKQTHEVDKVLLRDNLFIDVPSERKLSNQGYAIACDAGLLLAQCLLKIGKDKIFWEILKRPRSAASFNLPVLQGFDSEMHFDPIASSIAQSWGVLRQSNNKDRWLKIYEYWKQKI